MQLFYKNSHFLTLDNIDILGDKLVIYETQNIEHAERDVIQNLNFRNLIKKIQNVLTLLLIYFFLSLFTMLCLRATALPFTDEHVK